VNIPLMALEIIVTEFLTNMVVSVSVHALRELARMSEDGHQGTLEGI
jgi:hypothetical protein